MSEEGHIGPTLHLKTERRAMGSSNGNGNGHVSNGKKRPPVEMAQMLGGRLLTIRPAATSWLGHS
jgi:hypothetical protein